MEWLRQLMGKYGAPAVLAAFAILVVVLFQRDDLQPGKATLLGSALGAVIAVGMAASVAAWERKQKVTTVVRYCASTLQAVVDALHPIVAVFDEIGDDSRIPEEHAERLQEARELLVGRLGWVSPRLRRIEAEFLDMPAAAIEQIEDFEHSWVKINPQVVHGLEEWKFTYLEETDYPQRPKVAKAAREIHDRLTASVRFLELLADGQVH